MKTLTICLVLWLFVWPPALAQTTKLSDSVVSEMIYDNCAEIWPDDWRRHQVCTDYQIYAWQDSLGFGTRSLLQNWNTGSLNFNGTLKFVVPPPQELAFNLVIINPIGDTVYNRLAHYPLLGENWSFSIGFLQYVYTQENITIINPIPGTYTVKSIIMANQFTGHTVTLTFSIDSPVPVEATSFTARVEQNNVRLSWTTATELNNAGFYIERRGLSENYQIISDFIPGQGTTTTTHNYDYIDYNVLNGLYQYRLNQLDLDGSNKYLGSLDVAIGLIPNEPRLQQNYPNPFNPVTTIHYVLPEVTQVKLSLYNLLGEEVRILVNHEMPAGNHTLVFDGSNLPGGTYFYQLVAGNYKEIKKMSILK